MVTDEQNTPSVAKEEIKQRKGTLREVLKPELDGISGEEQLGALLEEYHEVFSLSKEDGGETDLSFISTQEMPCHGSTQHTEFPLQLGRR